MVEPEPRKVVDVSALCNKCEPVRRERCHHSVGEIPTLQLSFRPVAIGTILEVTKQLKLLM